MTRRQFLTAILLLISSFASADTTTTNFGFILPSTGSLNWAGKVDDWMVKIDTGVPGLKIPNTFLSSNTFLAPILMSGTSIQLTGPNGYITSASSVTASAFFGDGSHMTGTPPAGAAGGSLSGNYPNPTIASGVVGASQLASGIGISSGCAAGYYLSTMTVTNGIVTGGGCVLAGTGSGGSIALATGTLTTGATPYAAASLVTFDSTFVNLSTNAALGSSTLFATFKNMGGITSAPTRTDITANGTCSPAANCSGGSLYVPPTGVSYLRVRECAGGGGGGATYNGGTVGYTANISSFNSVNVSGGAGGQAGTGAATSQGGIPGAAGSGTANLRAPGQGGASGSASAGGLGGNSAFFGGGGNVGTTGAVGGAGGVNTGGGGGGGSYTGPGAAGGGAGGAAGECAEILVPSPLAANYSYGVSTGALGGTGGSFSGGAGGSGRIVIDEYYGTQGFSAPASTQVYPSGTATATSLGVCIAGSTATWTSSGAPAIISFSGSIKDSAISTPFVCPVLNGALMAGCGTATGFTSSTNTVVNGQVTYSFSVLSPALTAGVNNVCLSAAANAGTLTIPAPGSVSALTVIEQKNAIGTGDVSSNGTNALSGATSIIQGGTFTANLGSTVTLNNYMTSPSTTAANSLNEGMWPVVVVNFPSTAGSMNYAINVTSITYNGTGQYIINFARPFASGTAYGCTASVEWTAATTIMSQVFGATSSQGFAAGAKNANSIGLITFTTGGSDTNPTNIMVTCYGKQ